MSIAVSFLFGSFNRCWCGNMFLQTFLYVPYLHVLVSSYLVHPNGCRIYADCMAQVVPTIASCKLWEGSFWCKLWKCHGSHWSPQELTSSYDGLLFLKTLNLVTWGFEVVLLKCRFFLGLISRSTSIYWFGFAHTFAGTCSCFFARWNPLHKRKQKSILSRCILLTRSCIIFLFSSSTFYCHPIES